MVGRGRLHLRDERRLARVTVPLRPPTSERTAVTPAPPSAAPDPEARRTAIVRACAQLDGWGLRQLLDQSHHDIGLDRTITEVLLPALRHVGDRWAAGEIDVSSEHLFSSTAERWLSARLSPVGPASRAPRALLACGPGETHLLALLALETLLNARGWAVDNLGAATPASCLRTAVRVTRPTAVVVVAHLPRNRAGTVAALAGVADRVPAANLYYAGGAFASEDDRTGLPGSHLGSDLVAAADRVAASPPRPR